MNIVIILTLVYMFALLTAVVVWLASCPRKERLKRIKSFKRGKFAFIYIAAVPLFALAHTANGKTPDGAFWLSIRTCIEAVVLKFDYATIEPLALENVLYHVAVEFLFSLIILNALMLTLSFCGQWIYDRLYLFATRLSRRKAVAVVGTGNHALDILASVPKGQRAVLFGDLTPELKDTAYLRHAGTCQLKDGDELGEKLRKRFGDFKKRKVSVIMAIDDDEKSLTYVKQLYSLVKAAQLTSIPLMEEAGLAVYVFAAKANAEIFEHYVEISNGIFHFINRHRQIAIDFIDRYPLTQFMTEREIDRATATVRDEIDLNVFMIGFGKLNESLFLASVSNNQFLTIKNGKLVSKPVKYHIYDRYYPQGKFTENADVHSGDLHHGYLRYREFTEYYKGRENDFLPPLPAPAEVIKHPVEVSHPDFYASVHSELMKENTYNYVIVSFGTDMENIDLAKKIRQKAVEWEVGSPIKIFVKVRDAKAMKALGDEFGNIIFFGSDGNCVYNAEVILRERLERMARLRHLLYAAEAEVKKSARPDSVSLDDKAICESARERWYSFKGYQRESNIYACLSARMKLQLCGFDYAEEGEDCSEAFIRAYEQNDPRTPSELTVAGKKVWKYSNAEQFRHSMRWNFAVQEHQRWSANMIACGLIPCSKREILTLSKQEAMDKRKHGNLTTMEGLVEFRKMVAAATGKTEEETDVIRYDYQLMDDIDWLLAQCGYKIIKK